MSNGKPSKFKAGDKVRLVKASKPKYWHIDMIGETFTLERKDKYLGWYLEGDNYNVLQEEDIELVQDEKQSTAKWLKENKWWIKCESKLQFELINQWLEENSGLRCQCNFHESIKVITNFNSSGKKDYIMWNDRDNYPKENKIKIEFETVVKSVTLPTIESEKDKKIRELQETIELAANQIKAIKEGM